MKKNDRRGGPVSKMVMAALVLASTAGFVSGLSRNVFNDDGLPGWVYVRELFSGSFPGQLIAAVTAANHPTPPRNVTRSASMVSYLSPSIWLERYGSRAVIEPIEIAAEPAAEPAANTVGVNANGTATFDANLFNVASTTTVASSPKEPSTVTILAATGTPEDFFQNSALTSAGNYTPATLPNNTIDVRITTPSSNNPLVISSASVTMESLTVANGSSYTIGNNTSTATSRSLTLGNSAGFTNFFSGVNNDLIYLTGGSSLVIQGANLQSGQATGTGALNVVLSSSGNFNIGSASTLTISSVISGSGQTITKTGAGTAIFSGANTYGTVGVTGTTVTAGTLLVNNTSGSGTGVGNVLVNGTGTLGGTGTISGSVTLASGGTLNPGPVGTSGTAAAVGTLHTGALTLQSGSFSNFDVSGVATYDQLISSGQIAFGGTLNVTIATGLNFTDGQILSLFTGTSVLANSEFTGITDGQNVVFNGYSFTADYTATGFNLVAVPEPSTWAGGALALLAVAYTQRRRFSKSGRKTG